MVLCNSLIVGEATTEELEPEPETEEPETEEPETKEDNTLILLGVGIVAVYFLMFK